MARVHTRGLARERESASRVTASRRLIGWLAMLGMALSAVLGGAAAPAAAHGGGDGDHRGGKPAFGKPALRDLAALRGVEVGSAVATDPLTNDEEYRRTLGRQFNSVTPENAMKWVNTEPARGEFDFERGDQIVDFAKEHGQTVHGHNLVWHSQLPSWLTEGDFGADELQSILFNHIDTVVNHYEDDVQSWDVVNEAFLSDGSLRNNMWLETLGRDYIAQAFRRAHAADPDAKLYINDYSVEGINAKSTGMYELVRSLKKRGVPIHGVGMQAHLINGLFPGTLQENIQRFVDLGVEVRITELDIRMELPVTDEKLRTQAKNYYQVMDACLSVDGCVGVSVWGFTDQYSWIPGFFEGQGAATPYDEEFEPKPAYYAMAFGLLRGGCGDRGSTGPGHFGGFFGCYHKGGHDRGHDRGNKGGWPAPGQLEHLAERMSE